jgi:hypothetical protein
MSYSGYYSSKNCCVKAKNQCPTPCPTGPTGPVGLPGPMGATGRIGPTGVSIDLSGVCYGDYIYWNDNTQNWVVGSENISLGCNAGNISQDDYAVAIGYQAGQTNQSENAIAIGNSAGQTTQGSGSIAIGYLAGQNGQAANSVVISALGTIVTGATANATYIAPIRNSYNSNILNYNTNTKEITYTTNPFDVSGNLDLSCNLITDVSGIYFCDGTYIGHGSSFDISTNEVLHLKSSQNIIIDPSNTLIMNGTLDMSSNNIINFGLNFNQTNNNSFVRFDTINKQLYYKPIYYANIFNTNIIDISNIGITKLTYNQMSEYYGIYYDVLNPSRIKFTQKGIYKIGTSIQFSRDAASGSDVYVWFMDTSANIHNSASIIHLNGSNAKSFNYVEIIYNINDESTQYIEVVTKASETGVRAYAVAETSPVPAVPSIITTVIQIG